MEIDSYDKLQPALLRGRIDACHAFLASRYEADKNTIDYWYWLGHMHYRAGDLLQALDIGFKLTRETAHYAWHIHYVADACAHLGIRNIGIAALEALASKPGFGAANAYYVRLSGNYNLGEDETVLHLPRDASVPVRPMDENLRTRSLMRAHGIAAGVQAFQQAYCGKEAIVALWPEMVDKLDSYWSGERELPRQLAIKAFSCGFGDFVQWFRYIRALQALGVEIVWDTLFDGLVSDYLLDGHDHDGARQLKAAGFVTGRNDASMWTGPFPLFAALFPVLGYHATDRYLTPRGDAQVDQLMREIRARAQNRPCVGIFWSSCESDNLYASRSLRHEYLAPVWEAHDDVHWVIMQRGHERARWLAQAHKVAHPAHAPDRAQAHAPTCLHDYVEDTQRFTVLPEGLSLAQTIGILDFLDGFVGNDGLLTHVRGALGRPGHLLLNARSSDWRYEQDAHATPWYPSLTLLRADAMGDWASLVTKLAASTWSA